MNIEERVKKIVIEHLGINEERFSLDTTFDELGADSLDDVELIMATEQEFNCDIPDDEAEKLRTPRLAVEYLTAKMQAA